MTKLIRLAENLVVADCGVEGGRDGTQLGISHFALFVCTYGNHLLTHLLLVFGMLAQIYCSWKDEG